jgi:hypothetical protein
VKPGRSIVGLGVVLLALLLAPASSTAVDSDLKFAYAFKVEASNGYEIVAWAGNERADGRGQIALFVGRGDGTAIYAAPAHLTATSLRADLGALGTVDLNVSPSGRKQVLHSGCDEGSGPSTYEPRRYEGRFEFHGEEGYANAESPAPRDFPRFFFGLACLGSGEGGEEVGPGFPGARLRLKAKQGDFRLGLQAHKNRPGKRAHFEVETHEKRGRVRISRYSEVWLGPNAFRFAPDLSSATIAPPAPFAGEGRFWRGSARSGSWSGDLTVDLPGRADLPLTGGGVKANLVRACRHGAEGGHTC